MRKYVFILLLVVIATSCHDVKVGYLEAENAVYVPDSLVVELEWDAQNNTRFENEADWVSSGIQGVLGTAPISYRITNVKVVGSEGNADALKAVCTMNGGGIFIVPFHHEIPKVTYLLSIEISNKDYSCCKDDIFKIIVKD